MKKVGDLFAELGFRPDASDGAKKAFVENLVRAAGGARRVEKRLQAEFVETYELPEPIVVRPKDTKGPQQMSFQLDLGPGPGLVSSEQTHAPHSKSKRRSG